MGLREKTDSKAKLDTTATSNLAAAQSFQAPTYYHDGDVELDAIERLKSNILMLDDLQQRLRFMNGELESILGRRNKKS